MLPPFQRELLSAPSISFALPLIYPEQITPYQSPRGDASNNNNQQKKRKKTSDSNRKQSAECKNVCTSLFTFVCVCVCCCCCFLLFFLICFILCVCVCLFFVLVLPLLLLLLVVPPSRFFQRTQCTEEPLSTQFDPHNTQIHLLIRTQPRTHTHT